MRAQLLAALRVLLVLTVLTGVAYPLTVTVIAQLGFEDQADGSLVTRDGVVIGSSRLRQDFTSATYFHPRPSAATDPVSAGSNLGPTNPHFLHAVAQRVDAYRAENDLAAGTRVPVDAVTASASGLDPLVSVTNARLQAPRVALERGLDLDTVLDLVDEHTTERTFGFLGEAGVDVLAINLALDDIAGDDDAAAGGA